MKSFNKIAKFFSRVLELANWITSGIIFILLIVAVIAPEWTKTHILLTGNNTVVNVYGFTIQVMTPAGELNMKAVYIYYIVCVILGSLMAMVFRNIHLILKTADGETWFSKGKTPFQEDVIRMIREIGIFMIAVPVVNIIFNIIARFVVGSGAELSSQLGHFAIGFAFVCLTQYFAYGEKLEKDTEGLI